MSRNRELTEGMRISYFTITVLQLRLGSPVGYYYRRSKQIQTYRPCTRLPTRSSKIIDLARTSLTPRKVFFFPLKKSQAYHSPEPPPSLHIVHVCLAKSLCSWPQRLMLMISILVLGAVRAISHYVHIAPKKWNPVIMNRRSAGVQTHLSVFFLIQYVSRLYTESGWRKRFLNWDERPLIASIRKTFKGNAKAVKDSPHRRHSPTAYC